MVNRVTANLPAALDLPPTRRVKLELERYTGVDLSLRIRCFPSNPTKVATAAGTLLQDGHNRDLTIEAEAIKFENQSVVQLKYPGPLAGGIEIKDGGFIFDSSGKIVNANFLYNDHYDGIIALDPVRRTPIAVTGAVFVKYIARYSRYTYKPSNEVIGGVQRVTYGDVMAYKAFDHQGKTIGAVDTLEIGVDRIQIDDYALAADVISYVVADNSTPPNSRWEYPDNWPIGSGNTTGLPPATYNGVGIEGPDPHRCIIDERLHEEIFVSKDGRSFNVKAPFFAENPFIGSNNYTPRTVIRTHQSPAPGFEAAWSGVDFSALISNLKNDYPGSIS